MAAPYSRNSEPSQDFIFIAIHLALSDRNAPRPELRTPPGDDQPRQAERIDPISAEVTVQYVALRTIPNAARSVVVHQPNLQRCHKRYDDADADAVVHRTGVREPEHPRRTHQPNSEQQIEPLLPIEKATNVANEIPAIRPRLPTNRALYPHLHLPRATASQIGLEPKADCKCPVPDSRRHFSILSSPLPCGRNATETGKPRQFPGILLSLKEPDERCPTDIVWKNCLQTQARRREAAKLQPPARRKQQHHT